ncbi:MAG: hypothetical protein ACRDXX_02060, partial [Stackebrandtia sp.]
APRNALREANASGFRAAAKLNAMSAALRRLLAAVLTTTLGLASAGCSADPTAQEWAADVCTALDPWMAEIDTLTADAGAAMDAETPQPDAQQELLNLLSGAAQASETARAKVAEAGTPDIADGDVIAQRFADSLEATRDAYRGAHDELEALDASKDDFYDDVQQVMDDLAVEYAQIPQVAELTSEELQDAFAATPECQ